MGHHEFLYQSELLHRAIAVYLYLEDRANKKGECWPSVKTMAEDLKLSKSTIRRGIKDLVKAGLLTTKQRYRENGGHSSLCYTIKRR
jgi:predicted transcriptional regulator